MQVIDSFIKRNSERLQEDQSAIKMYSLNQISQEDLKLNFNYTTGQSPRSSKERLSRIRKSNREDIKIEETLDDPIDIVASSKRLNNTQVIAHASLERPKQARARRVRGFAPSSPPPKGSLPVRLPASIHFPSQEPSENSFSQNMPSLLNFTFQKPGGHPLQLGPLAV